MIPHGQDIKIGNVVFKDVTVYSKTDEKREKRKYHASILGMDITVTNLANFDGKMSFRCDGIGLRSTTFKSPAIPFEIACEAALQHVKAKLEKILTNF